MMCVEGIFNLKCLLIEFVMPSLSQIYFGKQEIFKNWYEMFVLNIIQKVL